LLEFVAFLGRKPTAQRPEVGLNLSYSETISLLHQLWRERYISCDFRAEQDRVLNDILQTDQPDKERRPEFDTDESDPALQGASSGALLSGQKSDLDAASVGSGLDATKPRKDTVPR
jgi:hypothetical protein